jgi:hypothetical protein
MGKRLLNLLMASFLIVTLIVACQKTNDTDTDEEVVEDPTDYTWDTSTVVQITLSGISITVVPAVATVSGSKVTIKSAGTYNITGSLTDGQIIVNTKDDAPVRLILNGVNIKCTNSSPIYILKAKKSVVILPENTSNILTDGTSYVTVNGEPNATLFSNSYLTIYGNGSLTVTGNYNDGISSDDGLLIKSGTISVTAADDGIRGKDYLVIKNGNITVNSKGDGLKSDNETVTTSGYVTIDSAKVKITSSCDAISAVTNVVINSGNFTLTSGGGSSGTYTTSAKGIKGISGVTIEKGTFTINSADDAIHSNNEVKINSGTFAIATKDDAIHADASILINDGTINISKCYEGIESASIIINDGNISLVSSDDGINGTKGSRTEANDGSWVYINGGTLEINSSKGDGLDSNGSAAITGGTVIIHGPQSQPEVGFDINGSFNISGGFFLATGPNSGNMIEVPDATSAQYSVKVTSLSTLSASTLFHIRDAAGNDIVTYKPVRNVYYIVVSSSSLTSGSTYSIYTGGSSTGTLTNGVYAGGTYSGGTLKKSFTISGKITSVSF